MPTLVPPDGPIPARIMLVGEAPGAEEERLGQPFMGASGQELNRMLHEAGISRSECFVTNVARSRPLNNDISHFIAKTKKERTSEHTLFRDRYARAPIIDGANLLREEIKIVKPNIILALGNTPLWCLTGLYGITKWRGSMLREDWSGCETKLVPTVHPALVLREWAWRAIAVADIRRAARFISGAPYPVPGWQFRTAPTLEDVISCLRNLLSIADHAEIWIDFDLETKNGHIDCAGISWTRTDALCIPFMSKVRSDGAYWSVDEESIIVWHLWKLLTHPHVSVRGQNLLYDSQYTYRHWHFIPRVRQDTMISHHVAFAGLRKSLDFQASMYCDSYVQWKPDKSAWKEGG